MTKTIIVTVLGAVIRALCKLLTGGCCFHTLDGKEESHEETPIKPQGE